MIKLLSGYKTYIVCAGAILTALGAYASGSIDLTHLIQYVFSAIAGITLRAGITKSGPNQ